MHFANDYCRHGPSSCSCAPKSTIFPSVTTMIGYGFAPSGCLPRSSSCCAPANTVGWVSARDLYALWRLCRHGPSSLSCAKKHYFHLSTQRWVDVPHHRMHARSSNCCTSANAVGIEASLGSAREIFILPPMAMPTGLVRCTFLLLLCTQKHYFPHLSTQQ
jgi:hypothetical protein